MQLLSAARGTLASIHATRATLALSCGRLRLKTARRSSTSSHRCTLRRSCSAPTRLAARCAARHAARNRVLPKRSRAGVVEAPCSAKSSRPRASHAKCAKTTKKNGDSGESNPHRSQHQIPAPAALASKGVQLSCMEYSHNCI